MVGQGILTKQHHIFTAVHTSRTNTKIINPISSDWLGGNLIAQIVSKKVSRLTSIII